jgi:hypothetical protein
MRSVFISRNESKRKKQKLKEITMKKLIVSLIVAVLMCPAAFAGHGGISFSISLSQPGYVPVYVAPQPVYACPQPVYVYPAPAYTYVPVRPVVGFSTFWGRGGHGYYGHRGGWYGCR